MKNKTNDTKNKITKRIHQQILSGDFQFRHINNSEILHIINLFLEELKQSMISNQPIELRKFGSFLPVDRKAKIGRNPMLPILPIYIPAKKSVKFMVSFLVENKMNSSS